MSTRTSRSVPLPLLSHLPEFHFSRFYSVIGYNICNLFLLLAIWFFIMTRNWNGVFGLVRTSFGNEATWLDQVSPADQKSILPFLMLLMSLLLTLAPDFASILYVLHRICKHLTLIFIKNRPETWPMLFYQPTWMLQTKVCWKLNRHIMGPLVLASSEFYVAA